MGCGDREVERTGADDLRWDKPGFPGDELAVGATVLAARRSESRPDRGIVRTFIEVLNPKSEAVMSMKMAKFVSCRQDSRWLLSAHRCLCYKERKSL